MTSLGAAEAVAPYKVQLEVFEGPLDLLLHLIRKHELDIFDIPVSFVTEKYLEYMALMQSLQLDVAAEYLLMAATLAHIKSRMLLPTPPADDEPDDEEMGDPRTELIRRLLEYQKFKDAAQDLVSRNLLLRDVFVRTPLDGPEEDPPLASVSLFALIEALKRVLDRVEGNLPREITVDRISVAERIAEIADKLRLRTEATFDDLFEGQSTRFEVVITFLALLEMARLRMLRLVQAAVGETIHVLLPPPDEIAASAPTAGPAGGQTTEGGQGASA